LNISYNQVYSVVNMESHKDNHDNCVFDCFNAASLFVSESYLLLLPFPFVLHFGWLFKRGIGRRWLWPVTELAQVDRCLFAVFY